MQHSHILSHKHRHPVWGPSSIPKIAPKLSEDNPNKILLASEEEAVVNCQSSYRQVFEMYCLTLAPMNGPTATYVSLAAPYFMQHSRRDASGRVKMRKGMQKQLTGSSLAEAPVCLREQTLRQLQKIATEGAIPWEGCRFINSHKLTHYIHATLTHFITQTSPSRVRVIAFLHFLSMKLFRWRHLTHSIKT